MKAPYPYGNGWTLMQIWTDHGYGQCCAHTDGYSGPEMVFENASRLCHGLYSISVSSSSYRQSAIPVSFSFCQFVNVHVYFLLRVQIIVVLFFAMRLIDMLTYSGGTCQEVVIRVITCTIGGEENNWLHHHLDSSFRKRLSGPTM